mmetsp:Transcript_13989/g.49675  ORF Transcript_13989/g.49675 Transcript_13989/m.49675 type:complete len:388 (-) Transcript_13989:3264-4427(-)
MDAMTSDRLVLDSCALNASSGPASGCGDAFSGPEAAMAATASSEKKRPSMTAARAARNASTGPALSFTGLATRCAACVATAWAAATSRARAARPRRRAAMAVAAVERLSNLSNAEGGRDRRSPVDPAPEPKAEPSTAESSTAESSTAWESAPGESSPPALESSASSAEPSGHPPQPSGQPLAERNEFAGFPRSVIAARGRPHSDSAAAKATSGIASAPCSGGSDLWAKGRQRRPSSRGLRPPAQMPLCRPLVPDFSARASRGVVELEAASWFAGLDDSSEKVVRHGSTQRPAHVRRVSEGARAAALRKKLCPEPGFADCRRGVKIESGVRCDEGKRRPFRLVLLVREVLVRSEPLPLRLRERGEAEDAAAVGRVSEVHGVMARDRIH